MGLIAPGLLQELALSLGDGTSQLTPIQRVLLIVADVFRALFIIGPFVGLIGIYRNRIIRNKVS